MAPSKNIFGVDILGRFAKKSDLLKYLSELHNNLSALTQDVRNRPKGLENTALQLIATKLLDHTDKDVRLLTSCCIVEVLREFAPEAPYSDDDMVRIFEVIISQIRGISLYDKESAVGRQILYILNNLAQAKSCVVPIILAQNGVHGAEDVANSMFEAILSSVRVEHSEESK